MTAARELRFQRLAKALHQALRGNEVPEEEIERLFIYKKILAEAPGAGTAPANLAFIKQCLNGFRAEYPDKADLLSRRFLAKESAKSIASSASLSQEQINRLQKAAIKALAAWILVQERKHEDGFEFSLINSLPSPSYTQLFGAEKTTSTLSALLKPGQPPWVISLVGLGGLGKSALADWTIRRLIPSFPFQELFWYRTDGGQGRNVQKDQLLDQLSRRFLTGTIPWSEQLHELRKYLKTHACLIVFDNLDGELGDPELADALQDLANPGKFLLTSRQLPSPLTQVYAIQITELEQKPAMELLLYEVAQRGRQNAKTDLRRHFEGVYNCTGGNPFALRLVAGLLQAWSLPTVLNALQEREAGDVAEMYGGIFEKSWQALGDMARRVLISMPLVGAEGAREEHLRAISGLDQASLHAALFELRQRSLLEMRGSILEPRYGIHHLTETFVRDHIAKKGSAFRHSFESAVRANLDFWNNQLLSQQKTQVLRQETSNLERASKFGFEFKEDTLTYQLLNKLFPTILELNVAQNWIRYFLLALDQFTTDPAGGSSLLYQLGAFYWQLEQTEDALSAFRKSLDVAKRHNFHRLQAVAQMGICLSLWSAQDFEGAWQESQLIEKVLEGIAKEDPIRIRGLAILGIIAFASKKYDLAISSFQEALEGIPADQAFIKVQLELDLGLSLQAAGEPNDAAKKYNAAAALLNSLPDSEKYLANIEILRATLHYQKGKLDAAQAALGRAARLVRLDSNDLSTRALVEGQLGRVHFRAGETEKAIYFLGSAAKLWGQLGNSWMLTDTLEALGKTKK
jgi:tetratricopeptide (TPR) repeat protein